jgi:hypothetical protein
VFNPYQWAEREQGKLFDRPEISVQIAGKLLHNFSDQSISIEYSLG